MYYVCAYICAYVCVYVNPIIMYLCCRQEWMKLQDLIATRSKNLAGAYDIHKFNSDAKEILGRIQVSDQIHMYTYMY